ncbi:hypothetical protein ABE871_17460 [Enterococcus gilvus]|uniref:hypothetical protein n=1 Tax=Enterococcus gilvus TaxID=160453 RepID=UPI003D6BDFC0
MYAIELAITLDKSSENYYESFDIVALPFIPRKGEQILWNEKLYNVTDVLYGFETSEEEYGFVVSPEIQTSIVSGISYKVWLEEVL